MTVSHSDIPASVLEMVEKAQDDVREFVEDAGALVLASREAKTRMELAQVQLDNARLRALIKDARGMDGECPWCREQKGDEGHGPSEYCPDRNCPAFTPDGEVR